jgi:hypothetical protein
LLNTLEDVLARLGALEAALPPTDGVKWFTRLYQEATRDVVGALNADTMEDPGFLDRLGTFCGASYLEAFDMAGQGHRVPRAWQPLFETRRRQTVAPLQFAIAGINAHVNRDLALGLVATCGRSGLEPDHDSPQYRDFERLNDLIARAQERTKEWLLTGAVEELDRVFGDVDDVVANWSVTRARDAAWTHGTVLWHLREDRWLTGPYVLALERTVGLAGRLLLVPTAIA